jgi:hypothetical protein
VQNATVSAKSTNRERAKKNVVSPVNAVKQRRGRPPKERQADSDAGVLLRAENYSRALSSRWEDLAPGLAQAKEAVTEEGVERVTAAWIAAGFSDRTSDGFPPVSVLAPRVLRVLRDKKYPKQRQAQITFLADALSGFHLEPRTAHELCQRERENRHQRKVKSSRRSVVVSQSNTSAKFAQVVGCVHSRSRRRRSRFTRVCARTKTGASSGVDGIRTDCNATARIAPV